MASIALFSILVVFAYMTAWWLFAQYKGRNDVADVAWGLGFIVLGISLFIRTGWHDVRSYILITMLLVWGVRLAVHISLRHRGKPEDGRYQKMKSEWKYKTLQSYTNVFLTQGFFMLLVSTPIILYFANTPTVIRWYNIAGLVIWALGVSFESISDLQLSRFIRNPKNKNKIMRYGLWKYSRHPNYFGEISSWWGLYLFTLFMPLWPIGAVGPLTITILILGVSGIPMLEKRYADNKEYLQYQKTTSAFFPRRPKV